MMPARFSIREYHGSLELASAAYQGSGNPFYSLLMAAMRAADTDNLELLQQNWPQVWEELHARYNAPEGLLSDEIHETQRS
jgi:hypothetical protein